MARGITKEQVKNAAFLLHSQDKRRTLDAVRDILGSGSRSTIQKYLSECKKEYPELEDDAKQLVSVPIEAMTLFQETFSVWVMKEAEKQSNEYILILENEIEKLKEENMGYQTMAQEMKGKLEGYAEAHAQSTAVSQQQNNEQTRKINALENIVKEYAEKVSQLEKALYNMAHEKHMNKK